MNTTDFLSIATAICPDRDCIVFEDKRFTYAQINERVNQLAHALINLGVAKGDRVGVLAVNCNQYVEAYFASAKVGAIFVPLNFRAKAEELNYMINRAEIKILFIESRYLEIISPIKAQLPTVTHYICIDSKQELYYEDLIASQSTDDVITDIDDNDITILMFTSGTTGQPKAVPLGHDAFVTYALENVEPANPDIAERTILTVPLYHVAGIQAMLPSIYGGRTLIMMRQFELKEWMETVQKERATRAMLIPTMLKWIIDSPDFHTYDLSSLNVITYGAAPMPFEVIKKAIEMMPQVQFINGYGQTESASTLTTLDPEDHRITGTEEEKAKKWKRLQSSIGKPLPDVSIRIVDDEGNVVPPHAVGEINAKGPRIMKGYWGDEQKTAQTLTKDGWLRTGDMGYLDEDGYLYLAGRADDLIIRGGENISPEEVEEVLNSHPKIEESVVIGIPDPEFGEQPVSYVVLKEGETASTEEIIEFCRERLAPFKRPRNVMFIDSLPRNPLGKILRKKLREEHAQA
ncbi:MAG: long-chain-fatty-acid--CoA ligase [Deltaproteobacteria bacterium]|nr:long-chain-fatty-acid--CoA ligase [Deltaproteobacteria bacterium]